MKNLFAIPRLSLSEAFTILITLVVCLAGFIEAEIQSNYRKENSDRQEEKNFLSKESSFKENNQHSLEASNAKNDELKPNYFAYIKSLPETPLDKLNEKYTVYFGESDESDGEKENDGYNYDENEYYHFNYKRNDQNNRKMENNKLEKEKFNEPSQKETLNQNYYTKNFKDPNDKEIKTIEMLNFKEYHPNIGIDSSQNSFETQKQFSKNLSHKKTPSSESLDTLNVMDLKDNSAIDESLKDRKEESSSVLASVPSDSKITEVKKAVKGTDEKDSVKLKDPKSTEDSVKKDKEVALKDGKEVVSAKNLKDSSKTSEEKEKGVKLSESAKLEENVEKVSSNSKEGDSAKITKEDKDMSRFSNKGTSDVINPKEISQINNRANFVSSEFKESSDSVKIPESLISEKNSEEINENEKNVNLNNFSESFKEKSDNYGLLNEKKDLSNIFQEQEKSPYFTVPLNYEYSKDKPKDELYSKDELFQKRESWKPATNTQLKFPPPSTLLPSEQTLNHQGLPLDQQNLGQIDLSYDLTQKQNPFQTFDNPFPSSDMQNTDYYKNYMKSLRKYKSQQDNSKTINPEPPLSSYKLFRELSFHDKAENKKKKRSKLKKRRLFLSEEAPQEKEKEQINLSNLKKNDCKVQDTLLSQSEKCMVPAHEHQLSSMEAEKEDTKLLDGKKREEQLENTRLRRKSPLKFEYEIKVINQSPPDTKNAQYSRLTSTRLKKDIKTKPDKYLKKYPYSQVNRDDLTGLNSITDSKNEKKYKRKAPIGKRYDQKSVRTRAAPSGYYSNRVKFGQKSYSRNNEKTNADTNTPMSVNKMSSPYFNPGSSSNFDRNYQPGWESKSQNLNSDEDAYLKEDNSLFLVKKGEKAFKSFEDGSIKPSLSSDELDPEQLAKILSKANDYVVLKKTDNNKFRKISDYEPSSFSPSNFEGFPLYNKKFSFADQLSQYNLENNERPVFTDNKNLRTRSPNFRKDDKKYSATFRSSTSKSNLKKTLDKFKDLADFFKDSEQESTDNQYSNQEAKEERDIVFSEDKLPDPIVISNDGSESLNQKPQNSIYSISTNFKNIDMPSKKGELPNGGEEGKDLFTAEVKSDNSGSSLSPTLKTMFPEAKTINSITRNGNEIIVLDFNRSQLKPQYGFYMQQKTPKGQPYGAFNPNARNPSTNPLIFSGDRKVQLILENNPLSSKAKTKNEDSKIRLVDEKNKNYARMRNGEKQFMISAPLEYSELPSLLKNLIKKNVFAFNTKAVRKNSKEENPNREASENYKQFLRDLEKLSEINKNSFTKNYYSDPAVERINKVNIPSTSYSDLSTYSNMNFKQFGNFLRNIIPKDGPMYAEYDKNGEALSKNSKEFQNLNDAYQNIVNYRVDYSLEHPSQWFSNEEENEDKIENVPKEDADEISNILRNQELSKIKENNFAELRDQTEKASDKVHRLRREGLEKRNLEKTIEHAMTLQNNEVPDMKLEEQDISMSPDLMNSNILIAKDEKNENDPKFQTLKKADETKENSEEEKSLDSDYDSHLSELFENLSKNPKNPSGSTWNRKKRKNTHRQKRFSGRDLEDKVSKTEVQNTILKNLPEDNYQSVYSPGIKRSLLSIKNEAENADADEFDKNTAKKTQENCVRNAANKCVDPIILKLFGSDGYEEEKSRGRRSLTSPFHTNFKREIELDESMPNDFQNFLVTSLGGVGSQKREVVKKDEALWGGKESSQDNFNQVVENSSDGKETNEDSALEKREVSLGENQKTQGYSKSDFYSSQSDSDSSFADIMNPFNHAEKKIRSESKSKLRSKSSEFAEEKLPTQIRIQITNGSSKEKKSSKPIMDESETSSTDVENLPKEKEFFDKNKINPLLSNNLPKFHQVPKTKFSYSELKEDEHKDLGGKQKAYHVYQRKKRKRKKFVPENPMKPVKDFITFDQKAMESLLRNYKLNQNMMSDQTTQKIPVSHPLPQVETVYNPTQGTNKAQLDSARIGKMNSITNKNAESSKNSLQPNDASTYDDGIIRHYLKLDKINSNKGELKEFEDVDWKPYQRKLEMGLGLEQQPSRVNTFGTIQSPQKIQTGNPLTFSTNMDSPVLNSYTPNMNTYSQKPNQSPYNPFFYHNNMNNNLLYEVLKLKQELRNKNAMSKPYSKPFSYYDGTPYLNWGEKSWNYFDRDLNKKPYGQKNKMKGYYYPLVMKNTNQIEQKSKNPYLANKKFLKNLSFDKSLDLDNQSPVMENYRDIDYFDATDDDYLDEYPGKDLQFDEPLSKDAFKKLHPNKLQEIPNYDLKIPEMDDGLNEDEDELEDYEENAEEEDLDDYSLLAIPNISDPQLMANFHGTEKLQSDQSQPNIFSKFKYYNPQIKGPDSDQTKFISNTDDKLDLGALDTDLKINSDPMSGSTVLLQKANENVQVFGKNVMKNLNKHRNSFAWNPMTGNQIDQASNNWDSLIKNDLNFKKLRQDKLKRSQKNPQVGSRIFYASKTEINNDKDLIPSSQINKMKNNGNRKRSYYQIPSTYSYHAEFAGLGNNFDGESEQNEPHVDGNLMILEKMQEDENSEDENEDVKENLEDDGNAIALDNYLENIIGKYIMRKAIKSPIDSDEVSTKSEKKRKSDESIKHEMKKRSVQMQKFTEKEPKILKKRLSSGHLTENNFRKYHKKNLSRKRYIKDLNFSPYEITALIKTKSRNAEKGIQTKRSALDIFKKITNKDRDNKKVENLDGRTAGFEPLLSLTDKNSGRNSPLVQDKKTMNENLQKQTKTILPELKAHYPNEGQHLRSQLNEKKLEKNKEPLKEYQASSEQGPWKIDLSDKYESKAAEHSVKEHRKSLKNSKIMEPEFFNNDDESLKAFLVISKSVNKVKRNSADSLFPTSGSLRKDIGNSYRPESDEERRISEKQVRKRSLTGMNSSAEDVAKTSEDQTLESHVNMQERTKALRDTKSVSEGDSTPQAPQVLPRNIEKNRSFVTANDQSKNSRFLSRERLTKSVFSPISDENIIRNNRHINEETSEYLGQQIVDAILFHVNANPKFKHLIAPGLTMRAAAFKENTENNKKRALHQMEFSEQLQAFFKKFMFDLEKMTEKLVKKRMCHEIDKQSRQFLRSLIISPIESVKEEEKVEIEGKTFPNNEFHSKVKSYQNPGPFPVVAAVFEKPETNLRQKNEQSHKPEEQDDLQMKHSFLLKLIDSYQNLSEPEKEIFGKNYRSLLQELDQTSHLLSTPKNQPKLILSSRVATNNFQNGTRNINNDVNVDFEKMINIKTINSEKDKLTNDKSIPVPSQSVLPESSSGYLTSNKSQLQSKTVFHFTEVENPKMQNELETTTGTNSFETVDTANETENAMNQGVKDKRRLAQEYDHMLVPTPQSFDLLSYQSSTTQRNIIRNNELLAKNKIHENIAEINRNYSNKLNLEDYPSALRAYQSFDRSKELHKLSFHDVEKLQLPLKDQSPRMSNLGIPKTIRSVHKVSEHKSNVKANQLLQQNTDQFLEESRNPRSLITCANELSVESSFSNRKNWNGKAKYFYSKPVFPYRVDKKFFTPKIRPFECSKQCKRPPKDKQGCPFEYFFRKGSLPNNEAINKNTQGKSLREEISFLRQYFRKKRKRRIPHFLIHRPKGGAEKHKIFENLKNKAKF